MGKLAKLRQLPAGEIALLARAWLYLLAAKMALHSLSFPRVQRLAAGEVKEPVEMDPVRRDECIARTQRLQRIAAGHHLTTMTCLPRALALQRLLGDQGIGTELKIGVRREGETISAHAWVELEGMTLGEPGEISARYASLAQADP